MSGRQEPSFEEMVEQEYQHLSKVHPTPKDIPTCMQLFNTMVSCGGGFILHHHKFYPLQVRFLMTEHTRFRKRRVRNFGPCIDMVDWQVALKSLTIGSSV